MLVLHNVENHSFDIRSPLQILHDSEFNFILTGSRRFGNSTPESDYDFITSSSEKIKEFLISNKFVLLSNKSSSYMAPDIDVYRKDNVDVQLHDNARKQELVNIYLEKNPDIYKALLQTPKGKERMVFWKVLKLLI